MLIKLKKYSTVHNTFTEIELTHDKIESNMMMLPWTNDHTPLYLVVGNCTVHSKVLLMLCYR